MRLALLCCSYIVQLVAGFIALSLGYRSREICGLALVTLGQDTNLRGCLAFMGRALLLIRDPCLFLALLFLWPARSVIRLREKWFWIGVLATGVILFAIFRGEEDRVDTWMFYARRILFD